MSTMIHPSTNTMGKSSRIDTYNMKSDKPDLELVKTISSSDDEEEDQDEERVNEWTNVNTEAFLNSYEEMLRYQKDEMTMTLYHLDPLLELLENKQGSSSSTSSGKSKPVTATSFTREFTYTSLKQALDQMAEDDSLRIASHDRQWKFVLQLLTEDDVQGTVSNNNECISWAEIVMCYRVCVLAMQTLNQTPEPNALRARVRQRSLQILSSFRPKRKEENPVTSTPRNVKRPTVEWVESILIAGSLILLAMIMSGFLHKTNDVNSAPVSSPSDKLYPIPLFPGTDVQPFAVDNMKCPKKATFLDDADTLLIPGPTVTPFYSDEQLKDGVLPRPEKHVTSPPASVIQAKERLTASQRMTTKAAKMLVRGPLDSWSATSQDDIPANSVNTVQLQDDKEGAVMTSLGAVTVAGGIATASIVAPMTTSLLGTLGSTVPGLLSIGATVVVATLLAHGIRDFLDSILAKVRQAWRR